MAGGKKRASPGADEEKEFDIQLTEEMTDKLKEASRAQLKAELALEREGHKKMTVAFAKRREVVKTIPKFWAIALLNSPDISMQCQHADDRKALSFLEDVWVERDPDESRAFTIEFHFAENPYFTEKVLKKIYKYEPAASESAKDTTPDENGISEKMIDFDWERDIKIEPTSVTWKEGKNLVELYPRVEEEGDVRELGSFFNYFTQKDDPYDIGLLVVTAVFAEAIDFFSGRVMDEEVDSEMEDSDEEDEDEDEDAEEIDLEKPKKKKFKAA